MPESPGTHPAEQSIDRTEVLAQLHHSYSRVLTQPLEETFIGYEPLTKMDLRGYYKYDVTVYAPQGTRQSVSMTGSEYSSHAGGATPIMTLYPLSQVSELSTVQEITGKNVIAVLDNATNTKRSQDNYGTHYSTAKELYGMRLLLDGWDKESVESAKDLYASHKDRYYIVADNTGTLDILKSPTAPQQKDQALELLQAVDTTEASMLAERLDTFIEDYPELRKTYLEYQARALEAAERDMTGGAYLAYRARRLGTSMLKRVLSR